MPTQKFHVPGLTRADEARVEEELKRVPGVLYASASHSARCAEIEFDDDRIGIDGLRAALERLGYDSSLAG
jgi:copper chaperone CopZ